jgi:hypothetical protein
VVSAATVVAEPIACAISNELACDRSSPENPAEDSSATVRSPLRIAFGPMLGRTPSRPITHGWRSSMARSPEAKTEAPIRQPVSPASGT